MREQDDGWALSESDRDILSEIKATVWAWRTEAMSGHDLLALGAILTGLDAALNGDAPALVVRVGLSNATINADDEADIDGQSIEIGFSDEGIELARTLYVSTGQGRSRDHQTEVLAALTPTGQFNRGLTDRWILNARELKSYRVAIEASIDALPDYF